MDYVDSASLASFIFPWLCLKMLTVGWDYRGKDRIDMDIGKNRQNHNFPVAIFCCSDHSINYANGLSF